MDKDFEKLLEDMNIKGNDMEGLRKLTDGMVMMALFGLDEDKRDELREISGLCTNSINECRCVLLNNLQQADKKIRLIVVDGIMKAISKLEDEVLEYLGKADDK
jgi:hypothetical protein